MNKYLKIFLKIILVIILLCGLVVGGFQLSSKIQRNKISQEVEEVNKTCDTITIIKEQPELTFIKFSPKGLQEIHFQILRNGHLISDTISKVFTYTSEDQLYKKIKIPYQNFLRKDTIVVTVKKQMKYYISNFQYRSHSLHGMMGPVAVSECELYDNFNINNISDIQYISPQYAFRSNKKKDQIQFVKNDSEHYKKIVSQFKINEKQAVEIFLENRVDKNLASQPYPEIFIENYGNYYLFLEDQNYGKPPYFYKINAETGVLKIYKDYPLD